MMAGGVVIFVVKFISWQREKKTGQSPESELPADQHA